MKRIAIALLAISWASAAMATQQGTLALRRWTAADLCAKRAQEAFPDFTADSNARREAQLNACLEGQNLPPRAPLPPAH